MKKARRFAILRPGSSPIPSQKMSSAKYTFCPQFSGLETTFPRSQSSLCFFLVLLSFMACALYLATYYTAPPTSSIFRWPTIPSLRSTYPKSGLVYSSLQKTTIPQDNTAPAADPMDEDYEGLVRMSCKLPNLDPFHHTITEFIKEPAKLVCETEMYAEVFSATGSTLRQVKPFPANATYHCCFKSFSRSMHSDKEIRYSKPCHSIPPWREVKVTEEFIHILCSNSSPPSSSPAFQDMFAFVPLKPSVEARISSLLSSNKQSSHKGEPSSSSPNPDKLNIVILGLDGYTKVSDNTFPNIIPLLTGQSVEELQKTCWSRKDSYFDDCPFIWKNFSAAGYRTSYAEDSVWMGAFNYDKAGFRNQPTDYYLNPFSNYMESELGHEPAGNSKLCYGPRQSFQVLLDYIRETARAFSGSKPYFQFVWAASLFHDYLNLPRLGDALLLHTLHFLNSQNYLNQTLFILMSDHGPRWGEIRNTFQGKLEERMPLVYTVFPPWFISKYPALIENLKVNSNRLTTPFDLHSLLRHILHFPHLPKSFSTRKAQPRRAYSLFQKIPSSRTCPEAGIARHWCVCDAMLPLPLNTTFVKSGASFLVNHLNQLLSRVSTICSKLQLTRITQAVQLSQYEDHIPPPPQLKTKKPKSYSRILGKLIRTNRQAPPSSPTTPAPLSTSSSHSSSINQKTLINKISDTFPKSDSYKLSPSKLSSASSLPSSSQSSSSSSSLANPESITIQITLQTHPGDALFEATITGFRRRRTNNLELENNFGYTNWQISQTVSRINSYASQSTCLSDYTLQKYCFCQSPPSSRTSHH